MKRRPKNHCILWHRNLRRWCAGAGVAVGVLLGTMTRPAISATEVEGQAEHIQIQAQNASISEVLNAIPGRFNLTYKLGPKIDRVLTGRFSGTLSQVLDRVLDGNDYIVNVSGGGVEVVVLGVSRANSAGSQISVAGQGVGSREQLPVPVPAAVNPSPVSISVEPKPSPVPPLSSFISANAGNP